MTGKLNSSVISYNVCFWIFILNSLILELNCSALYFRHRGSTAALPADDLADYRLQIFYRYYMLLMSQNGKWLWLILPYLEIKDS